MPQAEGSEALGWPGKEKQNKCVRVAFPSTRIFLRYTVNQHVFDAEYALVITPLRTGRAAPAGLQNTSASALAY